MATQVGFQLESSLASKHLTDADYIKGGYIVVKTLAERNALPIYIETNGTVTQDGIIIKGSLVYVSDEQKSYRYDGTTWIEEKEGHEGTVKSITAGTGLTGGTITETGTIAVDTTVIQSKLDSTQMSAVNSGITSSKVSAYDDYATTKQATLYGSGTNQNIKTVNGINILGTGDIDIAIYSEGNGITISDEEEISIDTEVVALKTDLKISAEDKTIDW